VHALLPGACTFSSVALSGPGWTRSMAGGERPRKGKRVEQRFNDRKRPKPTKAELTQLANVRSGFVVTEVSGSHLAYCPRDGGKLSGAMKKCPKCCRQYAKAQLSETGSCKYACLLDARDLKTFWQRKIFWRMSSSFHSGVVWQTAPSVPLSAFLAIFSEDWDEAIYKTQTVQTHVKLLETTRAVEEFSAFSTVHEKKGAGTAKILATGELLFIVPPMEVTHTVSKSAGARVHFQYGWVSLTIAGRISKAEGMLVPEQGWDFVEKWIRDQAKNMLDCEMGVAPEMVFASEELLRAEYSSQEAFERARSDRSEVDEHYIMPRPAKQPKDPLVREEELAAAEEFHEEWNAMQEPGGNVLMLQGMCIDPRAWHSDLLGLSLAAHCLHACFMWLHACFLHEF
jgi:hypothetical protein